MSKQAALAFLAVAFIVPSIHAGQAAASCETKDDTAYTAAIRKATTETYFSTELVDHLPWSSCVPVFSMGLSEEGREMIVVAVADEATIQNLDRYKQITARLADPRGLGEADAQA